MADALSTLVGAAGTGLLQRTYFLQTQTADGIPKILAVLDAVTEEEPTFTADVTQHPVERGPEISDHIQLKNPTLRLKGTISNSPLDLQTTIGNLIAGGLSLITSSQARQNILNTGLQQGAGIAGAALLGGASGGVAGGAMDALMRTVLLNVYEARVPFDVITKRQRYESMVIESLRFPRDTSTGFQLAFEIEMIRLRVVSPFEVQINTVSEDVVTAATQSTNLGGQTGRAVSEQTSSAVGKSWLRSIVKGVGG